MIKKKAQEHADMKKAKREAEKRKKEKISKQIAAAFRDEASSPQELSKKEHLSEKKGGFELAG